MKILAITDLHGRPVTDLLNMPDIDIVLVLGDITTGGSLVETKERILPLCNTYPVVYAVPGNWDKSESQQWLTDEGISLDQKAVNIKGLTLYGVGGSSPTPFNTPYELNDEELDLKLAGCPKPNSDHRLVLCSHNPPYGVCDKIFTGKHVGSKPLRKFIEDRRPHLVLCGHIHEGRGIERIGNIPVLNPGSAPKHYALVKINENISIQLN